MDQGQEERIHCEHGPNAKKEGSSNHATFQIEGWDQIITTTQLLLGKKDIGNRKWEREERGSKGIGKSNSSIVKGSHVID